MIPENREEALQLGLNPCNYCQTGWASFTQKQSKSCKDNCNYLKRYFEKQNNRSKDLDGDD